MRRGHKVSHNEHTSWDEHTRDERTRLDDHSEYAADAHLLAAEVMDPMSETRVELLVDDEAGRSKECVASERWSVRGTPFLHKVGHTVEDLSVKTQVCAPHRASSGAGGLGPGGRCVVGCGKRRVVQLRAEDRARLCARVVRSNGITWIWTTVTAL